MPLPPITRFSSVATNPSSTNKNNGLYAPQLTTAQIASIPAKTKVNGGIWYNQDSKQLEVVVDDTVKIVNTGGGAGGGDVVGPGGAVADNLVSFGDNTGKLIADSGVAKGNVVTSITTSKTGNVATFADESGKIIKDSTVIIQQVPAVPALLRFSGEATRAPNVKVNEISNLGHIRFINDVSSIYVDTLTSVRFFPYNTQICSVFTSEVGSLGLSTSESALLEIHSDSGALLLSRLTTAERTALQMVSGIDGTNGMLLFNTDTTTFNGYDGTNWRDLPLLNTDGTLTVADPNLSNQAATKNYVDTSIALPAAAKFIIQTANSSVPNAQVLGSLTTGLLKNTTTTGLLSIAAPGSDYYSPGNPTTIIDNGLNFFIGTAARNLTLLTGLSNTGVGTESLLELTTGTKCTSVGNGNLKQNTTGTSNSSFGFGGLAVNVSGNYNSAFGAESLYNNISNNNSAFGYQSLFANITGGGNSAFGYQSLQNNTTNNNSAFGYRTLVINTTGTFNNAFGVLALAANTTGGANNAFGFQAMRANQTGIQNSAFGNNSLTANTTGSSNVAFGSFSGASMAIYNNCSFLGVGADASVNNLTNAVAIGYLASVGDSNCMVLGGTGSNQLSVGIGVTPRQPYVQLQFPQMHSNRKIVLYETGNNDHQVIGLGTALNTFRFQLDNNSALSSYTWNAATSGASSNELMRLTGTGFLGIGTATPNAPLQFSNALVSRKIVLFEGGTNDHQVYSIGVLGGTFKFQTSTLSDNFIFYAGVNSTTSNELMRLTGNGNLLLGTIAGSARINIVGGITNVTAEESCIRVAPLVNTNTAKIELLAASLWELRSEGVAGGGSFSIYNRSAGSYGLAIGGVFSVAKQSSASYYGSASTPTTVVTPGTFVKLQWPAAVSSTFNNYTYATSKLTYTPTGLTVPIINQTINFAITAGHNGATSGEITTFALYKNNVLIATVRDTITAFTPATAIIFSVKTVYLTRGTTVTAGDYFEIFITSSVGRIITVTDFNFTISST